MCRQQREEQNRKKKKRDGREGDKRGNKQQTFTT
jgi:hypothetical protein